MNELMSMKLYRGFYDRDCELVARELLGKLIVNLRGGTPRVVRIVETEAYLGPFDKAAHSRHGQTARTRVLFGPAGHLYMYLVYGLHALLNVTTAGDGAAVLIRAAEPVAGIIGMTNGPGLLTRTMGIGLQDYGLDLTSGSDLFLAGDGFLVDEVGNSTRIGVDYAGEWREKQLRFFISGNPHLSRR